MSKRAAFIPLRAGSKGLPGKNTRLLLGKPLFMHTVDQALASGLDRVLISTDIPEILNATLPAQIMLHPRPAALAGDTVPMDAVLVDALSLAALDGHTIALLQATSPLRRPVDIAGAFALYDRGEFDLVMSVCETDRSILKYGMVADGHYRPLSRPEYVFSNRQELPQVWRPNGAVYIFAVDWFRRQNTLATDRIGAYQMEVAFSLDIDSLDDFERCAIQLATHAETQP